MKHIKLLDAAILVFLAAMFYHGCSNGTAPSAINASNQNASSKLHGYLPGLAGGDTAIGNGMFSVSWRKVRKPHDSTLTLEGNVIAVCFPDSLKPTSVARINPIDAGTVTLAYNSSTITLQKNATPRGVMYSLPRTPGGASPTVNFVAGATYTFAASGSNAFAPFQGSISAPQGLIAITSPVKNGSTDTMSDLTITWSGGAAGGNVAIMVDAMPPHHGKGGRDGRGGSDSGKTGLRGGKSRRGRTSGVSGDQPSLTNREPGSDNHWGTQGSHRGGSWGAREGTHAGRERKGIMVRVTSNTGSYTIHIATLKTLPHFGSGTRLSISVGETDKTAFAHDSGSVSVGFRSGDHVGIVVK